MSILNNWFAYEGWPLLHKHLFYIGNWMREITFFFLSTFCFGHFFFNNAVFPGMFMTRSLHHLLKEKLPDDVLSFLSSVFPLGAVSPKQKSLIINWQADTLFTVMNTEAFVLFRFDVNSFSFIINNSFRVNVFILIIMII